MKYLLLFFMALIPGCEKKIVNPVAIKQNPVLIKIEAEHLDGDIVTSPILLVR